MLKASSTMKKKESAIFGMNLLRAFPEQRAKIGLDGAPSHTITRNHMLRLPEASAEAQRCLGEAISKRGLAADSTGFGIHRYETWLTARPFENIRSSYESYNGLKTHWVRA
jgi:hypothetical protein